MALSVFDLFKIGIGPSSSHTVGPMKAAALFAQALQADGQMDATARIEVRLYGSLGATGKGHGTDTAVMLGLEGAQPDTIDPDAINSRIKAMRAAKTLRINGHKEIAFAEKTDVLFLRRETLSYHPNGVKFMAFDADGALLQERRYFSVGGGFVVSQEVADAQTPARVKCRASWPTRPRYVFRFPVATRSWRFARAAACRLPRSCAPMSCLGAPTPNSMPAWTAFGTR